jgi:peptide/nickel transport system substrate-binding protein
LKFSDGTPVDSEHVKATFEYNTKNGGGTADCAGIKIQTPDPQNITITGPEPQAIIESKTCNPRIAPKSYLEASKFDIPVGSGPYVLDAEKTTTGSVYTFTENEDYWDADQYPYQTLVVKVIKSGTAAVSALKTGQVDATLVDLNDVAEVEGSGLKNIALQWEGSPRRGDPSAGVAW